MDTKKANLPPTVSLYQVWNELVEKYGSDKELTDRLFKEIEKKYTSSKRHYHNLRHIQVLLQLCDDCSNRLTDKEVAAFAVFYHDIIYNVLRKDNEPRSAVLAVKRLHALGVSDHKNEQVKLFIEATQTHAVTGAVANTEDLKLFLDFDMSILGAPWPEYEAYTQQVRKEYRIYPDKLYIPGRTKFLQHCLQAPFIFQTNIFRDQYEAVARQNIAKELDALRPGN